jgi:hypothetical protein
LQQAAALRKDLRDSFAFLQERRGEGKAELPAESRADRTAEHAAKLKAKETDDKAQRGGRKKAPGKSK